MYHGNDELYFLLHTFRQLFQFAIPPRHDVKFLEPTGQTTACLWVGETFQLCQIDRLLPDFHLFIQPSLFRQVTDLVDVFRAGFMAVEANDSAIRCRNPVDDPDQGRLARPVRPQ